MALKTAKKFNLIKLVTEKVLDRKGLDVKVLNVSNYCSFSDYFIIVSATSSTHAQAIASNVRDSFPKINSKMEGYSKGEWIIVDLGDIVVHVFQHTVRGFYNLDKLWSHVPGVSFSKMGVASEPPLARVSSL